MGFCLKSAPACLSASDTPEGQRLHAVDGRLCDLTDTLTDAVNLAGGSQTVVITVADRTLMIREDASGRPAGSTRSLKEHVHVGCVVKRYVKCFWGGFGAGWNMSRNAGFTCIVQGD